MKILISVLLLGLSFSGSSFANSACGPDQMMQAQMARTSARDLFARGLISQAESLQVQIDLLEVELCAGQISNADFCSKTFAFLDQIASTKATVMADVLARRARLATRCP
jgi:hypothetical protein